MSFEHRHFPERFEEPRDELWDFDGATVTIVVPFCETCPPFFQWPTKHLILGTCPRCGRAHAKAWRMLKARRLVSDWDNTKRAKGPA